MDLEKVVASWPILRRVWRWMPTPLRWIVVAIAAVGLWRRWRRRDELEAPEEPSADGGPAADGEPTGDDAD